MAKQKSGMNTLAIHAGESPDPSSGAIVPPLILGNTFHLGTAENGAEIFSGEKEGYVYTRWANPTVAVLEKKIAALENAEAALATASGMAAIATAVMHIVRAGDHIVSARAIYPSTFHFFDQQLEALGIETTFVDGTDTKNVAQALKPNTRLIYLETPGNPLLSLIDLATCAGIAREANANGAKILTMCDNTFATAFNQHPLDLGIDIVVHSATKYFCGHGDATGGVIVGKKDFISQCSTETLRYYGGVLAPFNAFLIARGIATFPLRMARHNENAMSIAKYLEQHPKIAQVFYPGLPSHPQHGLAKKQMCGGYSGMVCFEVKGGVESGARMMNAVRLCALATSLGDARSLISHPASTSHVVLSREARLAQGVTDGLVRLSVGLEDVEDIIADLERGLKL